ncbi:MAG: LytR C-terminal domain-containing protein [Actinomycetota bacterium]|nr:LytR C-terminal domain-containing protein [Actinomycetota bacterium]MDQ6934135.1 LytR C-terminal domain-containing protein [Actinomycetota bacterium]
MTSRHLTTAATLVVLVLVLVGMAWWGLRTVSSPLPSLLPAATPTTCPSAARVAQRYLLRKEVTVSVFNTSNRAGLAANAMTQLEHANFRPGRVGNAPSNIHVFRAQVWTTKTHDPAARLVALALGKHSLVVHRKHRFGPGLAVFVGAAFYQLDPKAPHQIKLRKPIVTCVQGQ